MVAFKTHTFIDKGPYSSTQTSQAILVTSFDLTFVSHHEMVYNRHFFAIVDFGI